MGAAVSDPWLPSIEYEPPGQPSLFDRWETEGEAIMQAPLAVRDPEYRATLLRVFEGLPARGRRLIGIGLRQRPHGGRAGSCRLGRLGD